MNFLIVRLSAIGDVVHGLPVLSALRKHFPDSKIGWIVEELSAPLLINHPLLDELFIIPKKRWRGKILKHLSPEIIPFFKNLKSHNWDVAIDLQGLSKSGLVAFLSGAKKRLGFAGEESKEINFLFINEKITPPNNAIHIVERNLSLLKTLGIKNPEIEFPIIFDEKSLSWAEDYLKEIGWSEDNFILINIGAGWETKIIDIVLISELATKIIHKLNKKVLFVWGPSEKELIKTVSDKLKNIDNNFWKIAPSTNLHQLIAFIKKAQIFIGGDTGATHLAAGIDTPVIAIFGASDSRRNGPFSKKAKTIQRFDLDCVPCWKTKCKYNDDRYIQCLRTITSDEIIREIENILHK